MSNEYSPAFHRASALCAWIAALLVLVVQFALSGSPAPSDDEGRLALLVHPVYRAQGAALLAQVVFMFFALAGAGLVARRHAPGRILAGLAALGFWQVLEIVSRGIDVFTLGSWGFAYAGSDDPVEREALRASIRTAEGLLAGLGGVRRIFWMLGNLFFAAAFLSRSGWARAAGLLFLANALRLLFGEAASRLGSGGYGEAATPLFVAVVVPLFVALGVWLWRAPAAAER